MIIRLVVLIGLGLMCGINQVFAEEVTVYKLKTMVITKNLSESQKSGVTSIFCDLTKGGKRLRQQDSAAQGQSGTVDISRGNNQDGFLKFKIPVKNGVPDKYLCYISKFPMRVDGKIKPLSVEDYKKIRKGDHSMLYRRGFARGSVFRVSGPVPKK